MRAKTIARALGGRKVGSGWMARCPVHDDREPSLSIRHGADGKVLLCCHAGCEQGRVIAGLRSRGLWNHDNRRQSTRPVSWTTTTQKADRDNAGSGSWAAVTQLPDRDNIKRTKMALAIWQPTTTADHTLVETYLQSRGLKLPSLRRLRFHPGLKHPSGGIWPAMIALVTRGVDDAPVAIHRTFLGRNEAGKAPVDPQKMMLGPCRGGAVRLGELRDILMIGEGIESCLAAMLATRNPAWAALSTSGLRTLDLPHTVRQVIVLADGDDPGEVAAQDCAWRWKREGRCVRIARPPRGMDFNDLLLVRSLRIEAGKL